MSGRARVVRDVLLVLLVAWVGASMMTRSVLGWHKQPLNAPITYGDVVVLLFYGAWVLGCVAIMRVARKRGRSGWGWFFVAHTFSPLVAWAVLLALSRSTKDDHQSASSRVGGSWQPWASMSARTKVGVVAAVCVAAIAVWWGMRPAPETLTQQLWRECRDTLSYTHPEWDENYLDTMTKRCMDERLLRQGVR